MLSWGSGYPATLLVFQHLDKRATQENSHNHLKQGISKDNLHSLFPDGQSYETGLKVLSSYQLTQGCPWNLNAIAFYFFHICTNVCPVIVT